MERSLKIKRALAILLGGFILAVPAGLAAQWKPAMEGISPVQKGSWGYAYNIEFKTDGPLGRDWIYGGYYDQDSLRRCVAYREDGRWKPLPFFSSTYQNRAYDIEMYGDTLYIAGDFGGIVLDKDSSTLPNTGLLKWYNDSLWTSSTSSAYGPIYFPDDMTVKGDTLLIWGGGYQNPLDSSIIHTHFMTTDGGVSWQYPYSILHPTNSFLVDSVPNFGATARLEILDNGDILTLNNGSPQGNPFKGIARWDGQQWHSYGNGLFGGGYTHVLDFEFYKGELYMGGTFAQINTFYGDTLSIIPQNPGNSIVRWDGTQWQSLSTGVLEGGVSDIFVHDSILYCFTFSGVPDYHQFGDAFIPFLAGWDGHQWCGTPFDFTTPPASFGFVNDTLFATFYAKGRASPYNTGTIGDPVTYMNYYDGDYLHGPNAVCSTPGLGEEELASTTGKMQLYPNPVGNAFTILSDLGDPLEDVKVYDLKGQCVLENNQPDNFSGQFNISHLAPGIYMVTINGKHNQKLVKL